MGLDGGTFASRTDLLRRASWRLSQSDGGAHRSTRGGQLGVSDALASAGLERRNRQQEQFDGFSSCTLSGAAFPSRPGPKVIVACSLGQLYLRDAVVEYLTKSGQFREGMCDTVELTAAFGHIQRLRDVFEVQLKPNPEWFTSFDEASAAQSRAGPWRCPIDEEVSTNGQHAFVALRPCGHVMREKVALACARTGSSRRPMACASTSADAAIDAGAAATSAASSARLSDGISSIQNRSWDCPVCAAAVEVTVRLLCDDDDVIDKVRRSLVAKGEEKKASNAGKRKRPDTEPHRAERGEH